MKKGLIAVILIGMISCSVPKTNKLYTYQGIYGVASSFEFYDNGTFEYYWITGLIWDTTRGTWQKHNGKIYITSEYQPEDLSSFTISSASNISDSVTVIVTCDEQSNISEWQCIALKNGEVKMQGSSDIFSISPLSCKIIKPTVAIDSIKIISLYNLNNIAIYQPKDTLLPDTIWATLKPSNYYVSFDNKKVFSRMGRIVYNFTDYKGNNKRIVFLPKPFNINRMKHR